jgi:hypothetical protein
MAGDLATMISRIASEITRPDLAATQIPNAINDAISAYQSERFTFSEVPADGTQTFNTVAGQAYYTKADNPNLGTLLKIDRVNINIGTATIMQLKREDPETLILYNQQAGTMVGQPSWYAYENGQMIISAIPDKAYLITLGLFLNVPAPATNTEVGNPWMTTAEKLIRSRAKYEIALHVTRNEAMQAAMSPDPASSPFVNGGRAGASYREWKQLKGVANRSTARGVIRPMQF